MATGTAVSKRVNGKGWIAGKTIIHVVGNATPKKPKHNEEVFGIYSSCDEDGIYLLYKGERYYIRFDDIAKKPEEWTLNQIVSKLNGDRETL